MVVVVGGKWSLEDRAEGGVGGGWGGLGIGKGVHGGRKEGSRM